MNRIKNYFSVLILSALIGYSAQHNKIFAMKAEAAQSEKYTIIFDLDDTLINVNELKVYPTIAYKSPSNILSLLWMKFFGRKKDEYGNKRFKATNSTELAPGGGATSLGFYGIHGNNTTHFQAFIPEILNIYWHNAQFVPGAKILLDYLKANQYPIVYATNKDYTSYVNVAKRMDEKYNSFSTYPTFVLVTQPTQEWLDKELCEPAQKENTPENFRTLINEICTATEDKAKKIYFADGYEKPVDQYYKRLKTLMNHYFPNTKKYIFFDDKEINIIRAEKNGIGGYTIKTVADIVVGLEKEDILSPERDIVLYNNLAKEGVFGFLRQIAAYTYIKTPSKIAG